MMLSLDKYVLRVAFLDANFFNPEGFERGEVSFEVRHAPPASNRVVRVKIATVLTARVCSKRVSEIRRSAWARTATSR